MASAEFSGLRRGRAVEDDVGHLLAAQALDALLAEHPLDGVDDVALARAVGPDDDGDAGRELEPRLVGKALEADKFERLEHERFGWDDLGAIPGDSSPRLLEGQSPRASQGLPRTFHFTKKAWPRLDRIHWFCRAFRRQSQAQNASDSLFASGRRTARAAGCGHDLRLDFARASAMVRDIGLASRCR